MDIQGKNASRNLEIIGYVVVLTAAGLLSYLAWPKGGLYLLLADEVAHSTAGRIDAGPPALKAVPKRPDLAPLEPIQVRPDHLGRLLPTRESVQRRLASVLKNHPDEGVRSDFYALVASGEVALYISYEPSGTASFRVFPSSMLSIPLRAGESHVMAFTVHARWLSNLRGADGAEEAALVILHEYQHVRQYLDAAPSERSKREALLDYPLSEEVCARSWGDELEAYQKECPVMRSWGSTVPRYIQSLCMADGGVNRRELLRLFGELGRKQDKSCEAVYRRLANQPR